MPVLDPTIRTKISALRTASRNWSAGIEVYELLRIDWESPPGPAYYADAPLHEMITLPFADPVQGIVTREGGRFFEIETQSALADSEVSIAVWDGGTGDFADLVYSQGEGIPCEILLYFPLEDLLISVWQGHLRTSEDADHYVWRGTVANGFRSPNMDLPRRAHYTACQAVFGAHLDSIPEVAENDCPYNKHLPTGTTGINNPGTGQPWTFCDRRTTASCTARGIDPLYHLSHSGSIVTVLNNQSKGPQLLSSARGNESNLKEPVRVVMGTRFVRDMQVLQFRRDYNNNDPDKGFFAAIYEVAEGPIAAISAAEVNGKPVSAQHYNYRLGQKAQPVIDSALTTHGYSGTALIRYVYGWVDPATVGPDSMRAAALIAGLNNIRVYSDADTYTESYTVNRVWQIARMYCDKRWGLGNDYSRLALAAWVEAAGWSEEYVRFTDEFGTNWDHQRSDSNVELTGRAGSQQIEDMCLAGRLTRPFLFQNKIHIEPLRALTTEELADCPVFTDTGANRNIIFDGDERSTLRYSQKSDLDLPNRIEATFYDTANNYTETPIDPVEDIEQQFRAGRVQGDNSRRVVSKKYSLLGVTSKAEAVKIAYALLWFGEFDEGGSKNNLTVRFTTFILESLELHEGKVIKIVSAQLARFGFDYFRIKKLSRTGDLMVEISAVAYNETEMDAFETVQTPPGGFFSGDPGALGIETSRVLQSKISGIDYADGLLSLDIGLEV